jgi:ketopantoate hydroxymethyltransferase
MATKRRRKNLSSPEKTQKAIHALFILQAAQLGMNVHDMRKILGVAMSDILLITKAVNKALKKKGSRDKKKSS